MISFLGVGVVAIPTGIISAGFVEQYTQLQNRNKVNTGVRGTVSITVNDDSLFRNQSVQKIEEGFGVDVIAFVRKGAVILPSDSIVIEEGDILLYQTFKRERKE